MSDESQAEDLLNEAKNQKRTNTGVIDDSPSLQNAIKETYGELDSGEAPSNLTLRDENLAALLRGLQKTGELEDVTRAAREQLGAEDADDPGSRSEALRALIRVGLDQTDPHLIEVAIDARRAYLKDKDESF